MRNPSFSGRFQLVLHLHGLYDEDALVSSDWLAFLDEQADDAPGHRGFDGDGTIAPSRGTPPAQRAGILEAVSNALRTHMQRRLGGMTVENDTIGLAGNKQ